MAIQRTPVKKEIVAHTVDDKFVLLIIYQSVVGLISWASLCVVDGCKNKTQVSPFSWKSQRGHLTWE